MRPGNLIRDFGWGDGGFSRPSPEPSHHGPIIIGILASLAAWIISLLSLLLLVFAIVATINLNRKLAGLESLAISVKHILLLWMGVACPHSFALLGVSVDLQNPWTALLYLVCTTWFASIGIGLIVTAVMVVNAIINRMQGRRPGFTKPNEHEQQQTSADPPAYEAVGLLEDREDVEEGMELQPEPGIKKLPEPEEASS